MAAVFVLHPFMLNNFFWSESHFDEFRWYAADDRVGGARLRHDSPGSHDTSSSDGHPFQYCYVGPYPHPILDDDGQVILRQLLIHRHVDDVLTDDVNPVVARDDGRSWPEDNLLPNGQWCLRTIECAPFRNRRPVTYREILQPLDVR